MFVLEILFENFEMKTLQAKAKCERKLINMDSSPSMNP